MSEFMIEKVNIHNILEGSLRIENVMISERQRVTTYSIVVIAKEKATSCRFIRDAKSS